MVSRFDCSRKGFTITEFLSVMVIMGLVISGAIAIFINSTTVWKEGGVQITLQRKASIVMEKMVRGSGGTGEAYGTNGIREASNVALYSSDTEIRYTSGIDNQERSFYLSGSEIKYDSDVSDPSNAELTIATNVRALLFVNDTINTPDIVTINLGMEGQVIDRLINVDLVTDVKLRNRN